METKRNLWPYGIISAFVLFILGTAALIALACSSKSDLVSADYYEQEIRYQAQLDGMNRAGGIAAQVGVDYDASHKRIAIKLPAGHAGAAAAGSIQLYRPSGAGLDQHLKLDLDEQGHQSIDASRLRSGLWKVKVLWTAGGENYFFERSVTVGL